MFRTVIGVTSGTISQVQLTQEEIEELSVPLAVTVPDVLSRFQAKAALDGWQLLTAAESLMLQEQTPQIIKLAWAEAVEFRRDSPAVIAMGALLSLDSEQLDQLFITGASIYV